MAKKSSGEGASSNKPRQERVEAAGDVSPFHSDKWARRMVLVLGCLVIFFIMYVVINGKVGRDSLGEPLVRGLLSLAFGILGAYFLGEIKFDSKMAGLTLQGAGGVVLAALTFVLAPGSKTPALLPPLAKLQPITLVDFRSSESPDDTARDYRQSQVVVTAPISIRNVAEPARHLSWDRTSATLTFDGMEVQLEGQYFVRQVKGEKGNWLGHPQPVTPVPIQSGDTISKEVLHWQSDSSPKLIWEDFIDRLVKSPLTIAILEFSVHLDGEEGGERVAIAKCRPNFAPRIPEILSFARSTDNRIPGRITVRCEPPAILP